MLNKSLNVLIAEDEMLVAESVKGMLADLGHQVAGYAANGRQAVAMTQDMHPDVVLMDIKMPELNGLEAARQIANRCPTPIVILSAFESREFISKASLVGVGAFLTKPTHQSELERALMIATARFEDIRILKKKNDRLSRTLEQVHRIKGYLPICSSCKKIRDEKDKWHPVDAYIRDHTGIEFTHGICPDCLDQLYEEYEDLV